MALAVVLLAALVIFIVTGVIVWAAYLLLARAGRFLRRRIVVKHSIVKL
jgi:cytochrome b subunit of formate dehydrogenase